MTLTGKLLREQFAGEVWVLDAGSDGRFELVGEVDPALVGQEITVEGQPDEAAFGFSMVGTRLRVTRITAR